jgi:DNA segregation ATPase FtsK/SpoIIIE-like protein
MVVGDDLAYAVDKMPHMLIAGVSGSGKSVFQHQLLYQLVTSDAVGRLHLVDLKGGVTFNRYSDNAKVSVVWQFEEVIMLVDELMAESERRQAALRSQGQEFWRGPRIFLFIDEYAEIQTEIDNAPKELRDDAKRLGRNLTSLARRARSLGIVLVCALQKATTDAMDSSLRTNLNLRVVFRQASRLMASSMLDDMDSLPADPLTLPAGRFILYDATRGLKAVMQTHIAPGIDLANND